MKLAITLLTLTLASQALASHCKRPKELPFAVIERATEEFKLACPGTVADNEIIITDWDFLSWDTEQYFNLTFSNTQYKVMVEVENDCFYGQGFELKKLELVNGCY